MHKQRNHTMIKTFRLFLTAALLAVAVGILPVPVAYAATRYVSTTGEDTGDCTTSVCLTIVYAIGQASSGDTINVAAGTYYENVTINKSLTLIGAGEASTIVDGGGVDRVFLVGNTDSSVTVTISHVKIQNGGNATWGGGVKNYATLTLTNVTVSNNEDDDAGGGICNRPDATLTLTNCTVGGNSAPFGPGIYNWGTAELTSCTVSGNEGEWDGGIYNDGGTAKLTNSTVSDNSAGLGGGISGAAGLYNRFSTMELTNCTVSDNIGGPHTYSGGINNYKGTVALTNCTVSGNIAGGIYNYEGTVSLTNCTVSGNSADWGGGILSSGNHEGTLTLTNCTVSDNKADVHGGGIFNGNVSTMTLTNSTISGNSATNGGGIYNRYKAELANCTVSGNSAPNGGGIYIEATGTVELTNSIVAAQASGADCAGDPVTSLGHNLDSDGTCNLTATGDIPSTNPLLGPLQLNAPGNTETHAIQPGSPAIDQIPSGTNDCGTTYTTDQRGETRPVDYTNSGTAKCDIGAFEMQGQETDTVSNPQNGVTYDLKTVNAKVKFNSGAGSGGSVSVTKSNQPPGGGTTGEGEVSAIWEISVTGIGDYNADLTLCYTEGELGGSVEESNLELYRWDGDSWVQMGCTGEVDTVNNCVTLCGITEFSDWTQGDPAAGGPDGPPTAVTLTHFTANAAGDGNGFVLPLALVTVGVIGGILLLRMRRWRE
jgi:hypothetical protein